MYRPGDTLVAEFITATLATGAAVNADSLPTVALVRNGVDDVTTVTVANVDTGRYRASCVINSAWNEGDVLSLVATTIIGAVTSKQVVMTDVLRATFAQWFAELLAADVPATNDPGTVGDSLNAARAMGFGKWVLSGTTLTLYGSDDFTPVKVFTLNSATTPTQRS